MASVIPDYVSDIVDAAKTVSNSGQYGANNEAFIPLAPDSTGQEAINAVKDLPASLNNANEGIKKAAQYQQDVTTPTGKNVKNAGLAVIQAATPVEQNAVDEYRNAVQQTHQKTYDVENAIRDANDAASIDPNGPKGYLGRMGIGQKTLTAIGLVLSGIGSGLAGQPNMAYDMLQKNIDRDIQNQKDIFQQKMEVAAKQKGLLQSAQDRQTLAMAALTAATLTVTQGASTALQGAQAQVAGGSSNALVDQTLLMNKQKNVQALSNYNEKYIKTIKSGNTKSVNLLGVGADVVSEHLGNGPIGLNKKPLDTAQAMDPNNPALTPKSAHSPQDYHSKNPFTSNSDSPQPKSQADVEKETFLDRIAKSGDIGWFGEKKKDSDK